MAWLRLVRVFHQVEQRSGHGLRCHGLSPAQFDVLAHVGAAEGLTQQELADALLVTKGNVCQLLDRMQQAGLIERRPEGRANRLYLGQPGRSLFEAVVPAHEALIAQQLAALSSDEQRTLLGLLRRVDHALQRGGAPAPSDAPSSPNSAECAS